MSKALYQPPNKFIGSRKRGQDADWGLVNKGLTNPRRVKRQHNFSWLLNLVLYCNSDLIWQAHIRVLKSLTESEQLNIEARRLNYCFLVQNCQLVVRDAGWWAERSIVALLEYISRLRLRAHTLKAEAPASWDHESSLLCDRCDWWADPRWSACPFDVQRHRHS